MDKKDKKMIDTDINLNKNYLHTLTLLLKLDILPALAGVAELADAHDSKSCSFGNGVRFPPSALSLPTGGFLFE